MSLGVPENPIEKGAQKHRPKTPEIFQLQHVRFFLGGVVFFFFGTQRNSLSRPGP